MRVHFHITYCYVSVRCPWVLACRDVKDNFGILCYAETVNGDLAQYLIPGMRLLGEFTVLEHLGRGGMGSVYRVERSMPTGPIQYAAKVLRDDALTDPAKRDGFIEEIRTWMGLPDHPNITACRFFRTIGDRLIVFSEYIDGGTLIDRVRGKRLESPENILRIILHCTAGLHASHQHGVIHQDIKPANILMTRDGTPKITDFGLSRMGRPQRQPPDIDTMDDRLLCVSVMGLTPAYCSPEQMAGGRVGFATDQWSLAVTLLYMVAGSVTWRFGGMVADAFEDILKNAGRERSFIDGLIPILSRCFQREPSRRYESIKAFGEACETLHHALTGSPLTADWSVSPGMSGSPHRDPDSALHFDTLKALDRDLRQWQQTPEPYTVQTLHALSSVLLEKYTVHTRLQDSSGAIDNLSDALALLENRSEVFRDTILLERILRVYLELIQQYLQHHKLTEAVFTERRLSRFLSALRTSGRGHALPEEPMALLYVQLGNMMQETERLDKAESYFLTALERLEKIPSDHWNILVIERYGYLVIQLFELHRRKGIQGNIEILYRRSLDRLDRRLESGPEYRILAVKAGLHQSFGLELNRTGRFREAVACFEAGIQTLQRMECPMDTIRCAALMAQLKMNKALTLTALHRVPEALTAFTDAAAACETLIYHRGHSRYLSLLGSIYLNRGIPLARLQRYDAAWDMFHRAERIFESLVENKRLLSQVRMLQIACLNRGEIEVRLEKSGDAVETLERALTLNEGPVQKGFPATAPEDRGNILVHLAEALAAAGRTGDARARLREGLQLLDAAFQETGHAECRAQLEWARETMGYLLE